VIDVERGCVRRVPVVNGKVAESVQQDKFIEPITGQRHAWQLAKPLLGRNLPCTGGTHQNVVTGVCDGFTGCAAQLRRIRHWVASLAI